MRKATLGILLGVLPNFALAVGDLDSFDQFYQELIPDLKQEVRSHLKDFPQTRQALAMTSREENRAFWLEISTKDSRGLSSIKWEGISDPIENFRFSAALWHMGVSILYYQGSLRTELGEGLPWYMSPLKWLNNSKEAKDSRKKTSLEIVAFIKERFKIPLANEISTHATTILEIISNPEWNKRYWMDNETHGEDLKVLEEKKFGFIGKVLAYVGRDPFYIYDTTDATPQHNDILSRYKYLCWVRDKISGLPPQCISDRADFYDALLKYNLDFDSKIALDFPAKYNQQQGTHRIDQERINRSGTLYAFNLSEALDNNFFCGRFDRAEELALNLEKMRYYKGDFTGSIFPALFNSAKANHKLIFSLCEEFSVDENTRGNIKLLSGLLIDQKYDEALKKISQRQIHTTPIENNYFYLDNTLNRLAFFIYTKKGDLNLAFFYRQKNGF